MIAHWLINSYAFGNQLYPPRPTSPTPEAINSFIAYYYSTPTSLPPPPPAAAGSTAPAEVFGRGDAAHVHPDRQ